MHLPQENPIQSDFRRDINIKNQFEAVLEASLEAHQAGRMPARLLLAALRSSPEETYTTISDPKYDIPNNLLLVRRIKGSNGTLEIEVQDPFSNLGMEYPSVTLGVDGKELIPTSIKIHNVHGGSSNAELKHKNIDIAQAVVKKFRRSHVWGFES